jgi:hypothetical protein
MNVKKFVTVAMLIGVVGLFAGCHEGSSDRHRYGRGYERSGNYREGYRDGRAAERRAENRRDDYADRDYWRRRW